jgi:CubicO group peptidase (beta-lactamase class C family)
MSSVLPVVLSATGVFLAACAGGDDGIADSTDTEVELASSTSVPDEAAETTPVESSVATTISVETTGPAPSTTESVVDESTVTSSLPASLDFSAIGPIVDDVLAETGLSGAGLIVVEEDGGVVYEDYWGDFDADRVSLIASSSKMISAGVLLRLQDDGVLDIDAPIADIVEWGSGNPDITVAQLLSNSSGLVGLGPNPAYGPYVCQFVGTEIEACAESIFITPDDDADVIAPDTEFRYGGAQWQTAGAVAEAVSGKTWAELIDEIYVQPCGLDTLGYNNHYAAYSESDAFGYPVALSGDLSVLEPTENPSIEGGAYSNVGDYGELLLMHLRGGMCGETEVLSQDALDTMHADRIGEVYNGDAADADTGYGMGWWVDRETGIISDGGLYGAYPWLDLEDGYGAYLVVEANGEVSGQIAEQIVPLIDDVFAVTG